MKTIILAAVAALALTATQASASACVVYGNSCGVQTYSSTVTTTNRPVVVSPIRRTITETRPGGRVGRSTAPGSTTTITSPGAKTTCQFDRCRTTVPVQRYYGD